MRREDRIRIAQGIARLKGLPCGHERRTGTAEIAQNGEQKERFPRLSLREIRTKYRGSMLVRQMAKKLGSERGIYVSAANLFGFLRREGYLLDLPECYNAPSAESVKQGLMVAAPSGTIANGVRYCTPYITREGYDFFSRLIMRKGGEL